MLELDWPRLDAVEQALGRLEREPHAGHELRGRLRGLRSLRVGAFRIIYELGDADRTVRVAAIRHRSVAYDSDPRMTSLTESPASLLARRRAADTDAAYATYDEQLLDVPDDWGDLESFRSAAAHRDGARRCLVVRATVDPGHRPA